MTGTQQFVEKPFTYGLCDMVVGNPVHQTAGLQRLLYENSKGEFFTDRSYALASEKGNPEKVKTHQKE